MAVRRDMGLLQYIAKLERQEREYESALNEIRIAKAHARRVLTGNDDQTGLPLDSAGAVGPYADMGVEEAAYRHLVSVGEKQKTAQVRKALLAGGLQSESKNLNSTVFSSLRRLVKKGMVEKVGPGIWIANSQAEETP